MVVDCDVSRGVFKSGKQRLSDLPPSARPSAFSVKPKTDGRYAAAARKGLPHTLYSTIITDAVYWAWMFVRQMETRTCRIHCSDSGSKEIFRKIGGSARIERDGGTDTIWMLDRTGTEGQRKRDECGQRGIGRKNRGWDGREDWEWESGWDWDWEWEWSEPSREWQLCWERDINSSPPNHHTKGDISCASLLIIIIDSTIGWATHAFIIIIVILVI